VTIGDLSLALISGGITARDIGIADDPSFSQQPFLRAKSLAVGVELMPLIFSRSLHVTSLTLDQPNLTLLRSPSGKWNFSSLGSAGGKSGGQSGSASAFSVQKLRITNGRLTVGSVPAHGKPSVYEAVNLEARNVGYDTAIPFTFDAKTPGGGAVRLEGTAGPIDRTDASQTPLSAKVTVNHMDLASTKFIDPASGIAGVLDYTATLKSDGKTARSEGNVKIDNMRLVRTGAPAKQPVTVDYVADYDMLREAGMLSKGDIHTGNSTAHLTGNFDTRGDSTLVHMKFNGSGLPVSDIQGLLPAVGVTLPSGSSLQGGTVNADFNLDGPVDRLVTTGLLNIANTRLAGFGLASKLAALSAFTGVQPSSETVIETLSSNLRVAPEGIRFDSLQMVVPALGALAGQGTIGANNALNFHMIAKLESQGGALGQMTSRIPMLGGGRQSGTIPFMIQGTTSQPVFVLDVAGMVSGDLGNAMKGAAGQPLQQQQQGLVDALTGLFGKKKK
jgi:AsmA protein